MYNKGEKIKTKIQFSLSGGIDTETELLNGSLYVTIISSLLCKDGIIRNSFVYDSQAYRVKPQVFRADKQ